ncbi:hypothetical protein ACNI3K_06255 [Demequina sp. SO4-13]|uniref:hypothetical protein n=1 Tax=Demequina sp. SO4-13 TaxID=3401027 RepID=UPI003AF63E77
MSIDVGPPRQSRRGRATAIVVIAAVGLTAIVAFAWWASPHDDQEPDPSPTPTVSEDTGPTAAQETALVYYDWLRWRHVAECFTAAGFPREPFLRYELARVPRVAAFLGVEAAVEDPSLPSPDLRWADEHGPGGPESPPARRLTEPGSPDSCLPDAPALQLPGGSAAGDLVAEARTDDAFLDTLAEYAWVAENPAPVALAVAEVQDPFEVTATDADGQQRWADRLARVTAAFEDQMVVVASTTTDQYAQAAGLGVGGGVIIVRVSGPGEDLANSWGRNWDQSCGEIAVSVGADGPFDASALPAACSAAQME